jgi:hypothetical protein
MKLLFFFLKMLSIFFNLFKVILSYYLCSYYFIAHICADYLFKENKIQMNPSRVSIDR